MKKGRERFELNLNKVENLLQQAQKEENPAWWLYQNNARTPLFMLEGLCKLYKKIHNEKVFDKLEAHFKKLEDGIGRIDYFDGFIKEFEPMPKVSSSCKDYILQKRTQATKELNEILQQEGWIGETASRPRKIRKKLKDLDWKKQKKEAYTIAEIYDSEIKEVLAFWDSCNHCFSQMEEQVHEIRRKLRWLSIYPQALQGLIQLIGSEETTDIQKSYLTQNILDSPYNVMPEPGNLVYVLLFVKNNFYALSWMINELGKEKDKGLGIDLLAQAIENTENIPLSYSVLKASEILMSDAYAKEKILAYCTSFCKTYFEAGLLPQLPDAVYEVIGN